MGVDEVGEVVDDVVDDAPEGVFGGVVANLFAGEGLCWGSHCGGELAEGRKRERWEVKETERRERGYKKRRRWRKGRKSSNES